MVFSQDILNKVKMQNLQSCQSRDGYAYSGTFCIGKTKVAYVQNSGNGGNTNYDFLSNEGQEVFNKFVNDNNIRQTIADNWNKNHEGFKWTAEKMDDETVLSTFAEEFMQISVDKKSIARWQKKGIVFGVRGSGRYQQVQWKHPLQKIVDAGYLNKIQEAYDRIKSELKEGEEVLNTNLEKLGVKL